MASRPRALEGELTRFNHCGVNLRNKIELVSLEQLIDNYVNMLNVSNTETLWQKLFSQNSFCSKYDLWCPNHDGSEQAIVGVRNFSDKGDKITDFLVKNARGGNAALIEIKTPSMELLKSNTYRGGVFGHSDKLTSSVNQVLNQIYYFHKTSYNEHDRPAFRDISCYRDFNRWKYREYC